MSLRDKLLKNTTIKDTAMINDSKVFDKKEMITTSVPAVNVALSGRVDGGLTAGLTVLAGPSKHFKTAFLLLMIKAFQQKYKDGIVLFYDSEFGTPQSYFKAFNIDMDRIVHTPISDIEQLKHDVMQQVNGLERGDKVFIGIDSIGNLASKKEVDDALDGKSVADMTRAKQLKSLFRMVTPHLSLKLLPMVVVNHIYMEQGMYPKAIVSGGTGIYYSADTIWIIGRQQEKDGTELTGYNFIINVEKSRYVQEKSKIPVSVSFEGGIETYSGLVDMGLELGVLEKPANGWYAIKGKEQKYRLKEIENDDFFWAEVFKNTDLAAKIRDRYTLSAGATAFLKTDVNFDDDEWAVQE